VQSIAGHI